jgi:hypothetical protein
MTLEIRVDVLPDADETGGIRATLLKFTLCKLSERI